MTRNRKLKNAVRAYLDEQNASGRELTYAQARDEYLVGQARPTATARPPLLMVVDYPDPQLTSPPCPGCDGKGVLPRTVFQDVDPDPATGRPRVLVLDVFCTACGGCGNTGHDPCPAGAHPADDTDNPYEYDDELDHDDAEPTTVPCPSCGPHRRGWNAVYAHGDGEGYAVFLRMPCGCTEDRIRILPDDEATVMLDRTPPQHDPRYPADWMAAFSGPDDQPVPFDRLFLSGLTGRPAPYLSRRRDEDGDDPQRDVFAFVGFDENTAAPVIGRYVWIGTAETDEEADALIEEAAL